MTDSRAADEECAVLIVGAGPTGLVLALWLTRLGIKVRIVDKSPEPGTTSRALGVQSRTLELYRQVGLADALVSEGVRTEAVNLWVKGTRAARVPLGEIGKGLSPFPYVLIHPQDAHERLLINRLAAAGVKVERPVELMGFSQQRATVRAAIRGPDGVEETIATQYLAGCDGARSKVREVLDVGFPGGTYSRLFYVADVEISGLPAPDELHVDLESLDLLAVFPLKGPHQARLVGTIGECSGEIRASLTFADVNHRALERMKLTVSRVHWFSTYRVHHRVASRFRERRVFLLGDAAHIHSPVGAQGMNTGIGDAVNLAWKMAAVLKGSAGDRLLDTYEAERIRFARGLIASTDRAFTLATKPGRRAEIVRTRLFPLIAALLVRLPPTRRFIFRKISQIAVNYRHSALSSGAAGGTCGGDRLPWTELSSHEDNFAPLESISWQVHVYGEPRGGMAEACAELGLPLHTFAWRESMRKNGLKQAASYLIRPDGYIALADPEGDPERVREYFEAVAVSASAGQ